MKKTFIIFLSIFSGSILWGNQFNQSHDPNKAYTHQSFVTYNGIPYRTVKSVPANANISITDTAYWSNLQEEAGDQELPAGQETPPTNVDTTQLADQNPGVTTTSPPEYASPSDSVEVAENTTATVYDASLSVVGATSYSKSGTDSSSFELNSTTGVLTFKETPNYENASDQGTDNNYSVTITAENDYGSDDLSLTVSVTNVVEKPEFSSSSSSIEVLENKSGPIHTIVATESPKYSISGGDDISAFSINSTTGELSFVGTPDFENPKDQGSDNTYSVTITAANAADSSELSLTISVTDDTSDNDLDSRFLGISTRGPVSKTVGMTGAVAVTGTGAKKVAFMAKGTTMLATDTTINVVRDPKMVIYQNDGSGWSVLGENDNHADANSTQNISTVSGKEGITLPSGAKEAAIVVDVKPGVSYAAIVTEEDNTIGDTEVREAIVEAYEISVDGSISEARFLGISTRGPISKTVGMTGAVAVTGTGAKKVAFMAKGTTMLATDTTINVVRDPKMVIYQNDGSGWSVLGENDNHADANSTQNISTVSGKEGITLPSGAKEAAIVVDVKPGVSYAAIVTEEDNTIGDTEVREAIVEAYEITD